MVKMQRPTRYYSSIQEKQVAKLVDGKVNVNSGAAPFCAGDVIKDNLLIECKTVMKPVGSFSVKKSVIEKANREAFEMGKENSVIAFNFEPNGKLYFVLDENYFKELLQNNK